MGEFVLPLIANRSGKEQIIQSIRNRLELGHLSDPAELDAKIKRFRDVRASLASYVGVIGAPFGETGLTVFEVLGRQIKLRDEIEKWPADLRQYEWPDTTKITDTRLGEICRLADEIEHAEQV